MPVLVNEHLSYHVGVILQIFRLVIVNVLSQFSWTHLHVLLTFTVLFCQVRYHDPLGCVLMNIDKIRSHAVCHKNYRSRNPKMIIIPVFLCSCIQNYVTEQGSEPNRKYMACISVYPDTRMGALYKGRISAESLTLAGCITIWDACQVDVRIRICSD